MIRSASSIVQQQWGKWSREAETGGRRSQLGGSKQDKFQPRPGRRQCRSPSRKGWEPEVGWGSQGASALQGPGKLQLLVRGVDHQTIP